MREASEGHIAGLGTKEPTGINFFQLKKEKCIGSLSKLPGEASEMNFVLAVFENQWVPYQ